MSIQITAGAGYGSLIAVGLGAGDAATQFSLGTRVGNWLTASPGDKDFLTMLDEDELNILRRRGVIDLVRFKRRWGVSLRLLENGRPQKFENLQARELASDLSRFTAAMVCIVAALDEIATASVVREVCKKLLTRLLGPVEHGEDLLASQLTTRINAWRSAAAVRDLNTECRKFRGNLLEQNFLVNGYISRDEAEDMADFLQWLLAGDTETYTTSSSDLTGLALCLNYLSFEVLSVEGLGSSLQETPCKFVYQSSTFLHKKHDKASDNFAEFCNRDLSTAVSLTQPEESITTYPIDYNTANRCRAAWASGQEAARYVRVQISDDCLAGEGMQAFGADLRFDFVDLGSKIKRAPITEIYSIASVMGFALNEELCVQLHRSLGREPKEMIRWLFYQTATQEDAFLDIDSLSCDEARVEAFTIFQAFFMGYYYSVFMTVVDTSTLQMKAVSGEWGYRSAGFLIHMRDLISQDGRRQNSYIQPSGHVSESSAEKPPVRSLKREKILHILAILFCNYRVDIPVLGQGELCLGIVGKRTILINSLLKAPSSPADIGRFVLLDVDVGGIPRNVQGLVRAGVAKPLPHRTVDDKPITHCPKERGPDIDCTQHIEADWDGNPESMSLCIRYKGRRIASVNPVHADKYFCQAYANAIDGLLPDGPIGPVVECDIRDFLDGTVPSIDSRGVPILIQAYQRPCMRYASVAWQGNSDFTVLLIKNRHVQFEKPYQKPLTIVAGDG